MTTPPTDETSIAHTAIESSPDIEVMLTTIDNPYSPFDQFDEWFAYDTQQGYNSCAFLARVAFISHELSEWEQQQEIENAINSIVQTDVHGVFIRAVRRTPKDSSFV